MRVGIIGSGVVSTTLAQGLVKHGHEVMLGTRDPAKLDSLQKDVPGAKAGSMDQTAAFAEVAILAVKGTAAIEALAPLAGALAGKVVIDATNPIADEPPQNGVLRFFTGPNDSLGERLQAAYPDVHFVKAFNSVGAPFMVNPSFSGGQPTMFIAGDNVEAKLKVTQILSQFGWEAADMGAVEASRAIEPLCQLWCIPGLIRNEWQHAFKLLKA